MPFKQRTQTCQNRLDFLLRYHGHDHFEAFLFTEHEMRLANAVMTLAGHISYNRISSGIDAVQQISHKGTLLTGHDHPNFLHWMQYEAHSRTPFPRPLKQCMPTLALQASYGITCHTPFG